MMQPLRLLLVEDNHLDAELILAVLELADYRCEAAFVDKRSDFIERLEQQTFDIILSDFMLASFSGAQALAIVREQGLDTPFIFVSGVLGEEYAVDMLKQGATDYVLKQRLRRLPAVVQRALTEVAERRQRIQVERALRETETHFRLLVNALKDYAVITLDPQGCIRTWNAAADRIFGYAPQEVIGRSACIFYGREGAQTFARRLDKTQRIGSCTDDRWLLRKDGHSFFASGVTTAIRDEEGGLIGYSKIIRDATEARIAADALRFAKEKAETANRAKDNFIAVLSHELRTPLTPILAAVRLIELKANLPKELTNTLEVIRRNVELEARLIDDLLDLTSIARGKLSLHFRIVDLLVLLESAIDMSTSEIHSKRLTLTKHVEATNTRVSGDAARLQQIIWNLVKNAVKFTPPGGKIDVRTFNPTPSTVAVAVKDTGIGISAEALSRIFSAFEQADETISHNFGGLGLGLAIAKTLAQKHSGTLTAESQGRDQGACFTLTLPLREQTLSAVDNKYKVDTVLASARGLHVLLVEDNEYTSSAMAQLLEALGHSVHVSATVNAALHAARETRFDLLISDIGLPDGSGLEVAKAWSTLQDDAPSIAITGYGMEEDIQRCKAAGFMNHLTKPVNIDRLEALICSLPSRAMD